VASEISIESYRLRVISLGDGGAKARVFSDSKLGLAIAKLVKTKAMRILERITANTPAVYFDVNNI
jgi:hypothetical protein